MVDAAMHEIRPVLDEEVNRLPDKFRVPFVLYHLEGRSNQEIARELGCCLGTVESRLTRAASAFVSACRAGASRWCWLGCAFSQGTSRGCLFTQNAGVFNNQGCRGAGGQQSCCSGADLLPRCSIDTGSVKNHVNCQTQNDRRDGAGRGSDCRRSETGRGSHRGWGTNRHHSGACAAAGCRQGRS